VSTTPVKKIFVEQAHLRDQVNTTKSTIPVLFNIGSTDVGKATLERRKSLRHVKPTDKSPEEKLPNPYTQVVLKAVTDLGLRNELAPTAKRRARAQEEIKRAEAKKKAEAENKPGLIRSERSATTKW
jgi:hypothetical protein